VDPSVGGTLSTADGSVSVDVPAGAYADTLTFSLALVDPAQQTGNLEVGSWVLLLTAQDSNGDSVSSFDLPLTITIPPWAAQAYGDPNGMAIWSLSPDTGDFELLPSTVNPDGTLTASLDVLAPVSDPEAAALDLSGSMP
jgi:hypothetical protein